MIPRESYFKQIEPFIGKISSRCLPAFAVYVAQGGFPLQDALRFERGSSVKYVEDVPSAILLKDVVKWSNIRDVDLLERLARHVAAEEGCLLSMKSTPDHLKSEHRKASPDTVANCMNAMEKAFCFTRFRAKTSSASSVLRLTQNDMLPIRI